eukprot:gene2109-4121_t
MMASPFDEKWSDLYNVRLLDPPILLKASVVHGFKRGSKELGVPTANLDMEELGDKGNLDTGIYYGWAYLDGIVYQSVISVGWNPFYKNVQKTVEAHLLHNLEDFYDAKLSILICGYLRNEANFDSIDALISCIQSDICLTREKLSQPPTSTYSDYKLWPIEPAAWSISFAMQDIKYGKSCMIQADKRECICVHFGADILNQLLTITRTQKSSMDLNNIRCSKICVVCNGGFLLACNIDINTSTLSIDFGFFRSLILALQYTIYGDMIVGYSTKSNRIIVKLTTKVLQMCRQGTLHPQELLFFGQAIRRNVISQTLVQEIVTVHDQPCNDILGTFIHVLFPVTSVI